MDPNANLERQLEDAREIVRVADDPAVGWDWESTDRDYLEQVARAAHQLAAHVLALHDWLSGGGFLPDAWSKLHLGHPNNSLTSAQALALGRRIDPTKAPAMGVQVMRDFSLPEGYILCRFDDGFVCGIAPNGDVSS